jgi:hypothetical protein
VIRISTKVILALSVLAWLLLGYACRGVAQDKSLQCRPNDFTCGGILTGTSTSGVSAAPSHCPEHYTLVTDSTFKNGIHHMLCAPTDTLIEATQQ